MPSVTTPDGVRLDYLESGTPTGRPIVLVAGFRATAASWRGQVRVLDRAGYRVIAFDRRGHGTSERGKHDDNTMAQHGADLVQLLTQLELSDAVLVGGAMGGNVCWSALAQPAAGQAAADRVAGVVIIDQTPKMLNSADWPHGFYGYDEGTRDTLFSKGIPDPGKVTTASKGVVRVVRQLAAVARGMAAPEKYTASQLALLKDHATSDWRAAIAKTAVPVLFIAGSESEYWPSSHAAASASLTAAGSALVVRKSGQAVHIEQPRSFNSALLRFIAALPPLG